jgi:hypothetical protein
MQPIRQLQKVPKRGCFFAHSQAALFATGCAVNAPAAQGGVTLGPEQGELEANFCYLGIKSSVDTPRIVGFPVTDEDGRVV